MAGTTQAYPKADPDAKIAFEIHDLDYNLRKQLDYAKKIAR